MAKKEPLLYTIGYEHATQPVLVEALVAKGVTTLIDVRELPASRRVGFSKRSLAAGLAEAGITYVHERALGTPKEGRIANKRRQWETFWSIVERALATPEAGLALERVAALASTSPCCLLCLEADPHVCHRDRVAALLMARYGFRVEHLRSSFDALAKKRS